MASLSSDVHWVSWPGVCSCVVGGMFYLFSFMKNKQASQIEAAIHIDKLSDLKGLAKLVPFLVAVTARVWTDNPLKCQPTSRGAVISEEKEDQLAMRQVDNGSWVNDQQKVRHTIREVPWCLEDGSCVRLPVLKGAGADEVHLELVGDEYTPLDQGIARKAMDNLLGWRVLGLRRTEHILPIGTTLAAVGEVARMADAAAAAVPGAVRTGDGGVLVLRAPKNGPFILSSRPLPELVASAATVARRCRMLAACFGGLGAALVVRQVVRTALAARRRSRLRKLMAAARQQLRDAAGAGGSGNGDAAADAAPTNGRARAGAAANGARDEEHTREGLCVVCFTHECNTVFAACGHMCVCSGCAPALAQCPICRARGDCIRVYRT